MVVYELCEIYEDDEMEEKEEQKKELEFNNSKQATYVSLTNISVHSTTEATLFSRINYIREFYLEIPIPPPEQA
jgi:hypothetical protein